jgi:hypothetical protein
MPEHENTGKRWCYTIAIDRGIIGLPVAAVASALYLAALPATGAYAALTGKTELLEKNFEGAMLTTFYPIMWSCSAFTCGEFGSYAVVDTLHNVGLVSRQEHRSVAW